MKMTIIKTLASTAMALGLVVSVQAGSITGGISLSGGVTYDTGSPATANAFTSFTGVTVAATGVSGSYLGVVAPGTAITMTPFTFKPTSSFPAGGVNPLWQTTADPTLASFNLTSIVSVSQGFDQVGNPFLTITGLGTLFLKGFTPTSGNWSYTAQSGGTSFSFSASNTALPDGGVTAILLGGALSVLGLVRRKLA